VMVLLSAVGGVKRECPTLQWCRHSVTTRRSCGPLATQRRRSCKVSDEIGRVAAAHVLQAATDGDGFITGINHCPWCEYQLSVVSVAPFRDDERQTTLNGERDSAWSVPAI